MTDDEAGVPAEIPRPRRTAGGSAAGEAEARVRRLVAARRRHHRAVQAARRAARAASAVR